MKNLPAAVAAGRKMTNIHFSKIDAVSLDNPFKEFSKDLLIPLDQGRI